MRLLLSIVIFCGIFLIIGEFWKVLEIILCGEIQPSSPDTIIGGILTISLYQHLAKTINKRKE